MIKKFGVIQKPAISSLEEYEEVFYKYARIKF
jgi:hypothetical protein